MLETQLLRFNRRHAKMPNFVLMSTHIRDELRKTVPTYVVSKKAGTMDQVLGLNIFPIETSKDVDTIQVGILDIYA